MAIARIGILALGLTACGSPPRTVIQTPAPPRIAPDFAVLLDGCAVDSLRIAEVGHDPVLVGVRIGDNQTSAAVLNLADGRQRVLSSASDEDALTSVPDSILVDGRSWDAFSLALAGNCAPNLESEDGHVECRALTWTVNGEHVALDSGRRGDSLTGATPPSGWEKELRAWKATSHCDAWRWNVLSPNLIFIATSEGCSFGRSAIMRRREGSLSQAIAAHADVDFEPARVGGDWWVVSRSNGSRVMGLWRVTGTGDVVSVALPPSPVDDVLVAGEHLWLATSDALYKPSTNEGWSRIDTCSPTPPTARLATTATGGTQGSSHILLTCDDHRMFISGPGSERLRHDSGPKEHWRAMDLSGAAVWLLEDGGALLQSHYRGPRWTCVKAGPLRFTQGVAPQATTSPIVRIGSYWPFGAVPARIGDVGQNGGTLYITVPGGSCVHTHCEATLSLARDCNDATGTAPCVFGQLRLETIFGAVDPLAARSVTLHHGIVGHLDVRASHLGGASLAWHVRSGNGIFEVTLRNGREDYLIALANAFVDVGL